jgi:hypothetical protein
MGGTSTGLGRKLQPVGEDAEDRDRLRLGGHAVGAVVQPLARQALDEHPEMLARVLGSSDKAG